MPDSSHDEISPFTPLAREKRIGLLRTYPPCVMVSFWIHIMGMRLSMWVRLTGCIAVCKLLVLDTVLLWKRYL